MSKEDRNIIGFTVFLVSEFASKYDITPKQAYSYLKRFDGLEHLNSHFNVIHTMSFEDAVASLSEVCYNNGGRLR